MRNPLIVLIALSSLISAGSVVYAAPPDGSNPQSSAPANQSYPSPAASPSLSAPTQSSNQSDAAKNQTAPTQVAPSPTAAGDASGSKIRSILNSTGNSTFAPQSINEKEQGAKCTITGKITDLSGVKGLSHATILLTKEGEEHKRAEVETDDNGAYTLNGLDSGAWSMTVTAPHMLSDTRKLDLSSGESKIISISLDDLEPEDTLRITGKRTLIHPEKIGSTTNLDHDTIYQYKTGNDLRQLIDSTPGVMTDTLRNMIVRGEHNAIQYDIDGVIMPEQAGVLQQSDFVNPRSLQSAQVDIGGYQASDGGGPLGAIVRMKTLPTTAAPSMTIGQQMGGPLAGNLYYNASSALSQDSNSILNKIRIDSSGSFRGTRIGTAPPAPDFSHNNRGDINSLTKIEYRKSENDIFKMTIGINETQLQVPTSQQSYAAGVRAQQHDRDDYMILSWKHRYKRFFDESNLHILNCFYDEHYQSANVFDPNPVINGGQPLQSIAPIASRFNYVFGAQGNITKTLFNTHRLEAGFLSEARWARTNFGATYYNNDPTIGPDVPVGAVISPFTGTTQGPMFNWGSNLGKLKTFRLVESAYFQDTWRPTTGWLKRLTVDAGARVDVDHGVFGNTQAVEQVLSTVPGVQPFSSQPFNTQRVTDAQVSGRYGLAYVINPTTVYRASFSNLFMPASVDVFSTPPTVSPDQLVNGVYNGTVRPMHATRGKLFDTSVEKQIGPRFSTRTNLFYKYLQNYGDSGVIGNSILYNRQSVAAQNAYGVETRLELKKSKDGFGLNGFISNTWQMARLAGSKQVTGGIYDIETTPIEDKWPDHDRREATQLALGWQSRHNWWVLANYSFLSGLQDERDPTLVGNHKGRTDMLSTFGLSAGYTVPKHIKAKLKFAPDTIDARFQNLLNNRLATNLGSPFQGTRFLLPFNFLIGCSWHVGKQEYRYSGKPNSTI